MQARLLESLHQLCEGDAHAQRFLLAFSGGIDSTALAHLLADVGVSFALAHCNFQLRGAESDGDEAFARQLAMELAVPCFTTTFDTQTVAANGHLSIQMAARELRYDWLEALRAQEGYDWILTAHHAQDVLETFFINLSRSAGLQGLQGIPARRNRILRPILWAERSEMEAFQKSRHFQYRHDASNNKEDYLRNRIRHRLLPVLDSVSPGFRAAVARSISALSHTQTLLNSLLEEKRHTFCVQENGQLLIHLDAIMQFPAPSPLLYEWLRPFGFQASQVADMLAHAAGGTGKSYYTATHRCLIDRRRLVVVERGTVQNPGSVQLDKPGTYHAFGLELEIYQPASAPSREEAGLNLVFIPICDLQRPMCWRLWRAGDRIAPLGMGGKHRKIQDVLTDRRLSRIQKENCTVLEDADGRILWIPGVMVSEWLRFDFEAAASCYGLRLIGF